MSTAAEEDRALAALRRVRDSREQDSRFGLQQALHAVRLRDEEAEVARSRRAATLSFGAGSLADFHAYRTFTAGMARAEEVATDRARSSRLVADEAERRWQHDRQEVRVVDLLLERRAQQRRAERARREAAELDDLATQSWLRRRSAEVTP